MNALAPASESSILIPGRPYLPKRAGRGRPARMGLDDTMPAGGRDIFTKSGQMVIDFQRSSADLAVSEQRNAVAARSLKRKWA